MLITAMIRRTGDSIKRNALFVAAIVRVLAKPIVILAGIPALAYALRRYSSSR
jgi:hypothetical protein